VPERKQWRPSEKGGGGREIYIAVSGGKSGGNPSEMARALAVQGLRSRALAAAPREPGPAETLDSGVPPGSGCRGHFARAGPGWGGGAGNRTGAGCTRGAWSSPVRVTKQPLRGLLNLLNVLEQEQVILLYNGHR
jgi:hypothetical protein